MSSNKMSLKPSLDDGRESVQRVPRKADKLNAYSRHLIDGACHPRILAVKHSAQYYKTVYSSNL
jgi:hypothetical protein